MDARVEEQVAFAVDAIRAANSHLGPVDHQVFFGLVDRVKAPVAGEAMKERRAFLRSVGERLQEEAGVSQEVKVTGLAGKHRRWERPDGQSIHDLGTLLIGIAKKR